MIDRVRGMAGAVRAARIVIVTLLGPGIITLAIPYLLLCCGLVRLPAHLSALQYAGLVALAAGLLVACWCMAAFTLVGRGTPTSTDPPKVLVAHGLYRLERNPMYSGVLLIVFGEAACCESAALGRWLRTIRPVHTALDTENALMMLVATQVVLPERLFGFGLALLILSACAGTPTITSIQSPAPLAASETSIPTPTSTATTLPPTLTPTATTLADFAWCPLPDDPPQPDPGILRL